MLGVVVAVVLLRTPPRATAPVRAAVTVAEALGGDTAGHARVTGPRPFVFPDDHGPHPEYRTEWWYFVGNLWSGDGRRFGYQLTIFRNAIAPPDHPMPTASEWAARHVYMAHFAVTDAAGRTFHAFERFARGAAGLAGAETAPLRVWLEDWEISGLFPARLRAAEDDVAIELLLTAAKPVVLQGDAGYSRKGATPGNASHYYSFTRLPTTGTIRVGGEPIEVRGTSWLDREWSTSALDDGQVGWDWFALQLDDGVDLMWYQLRRDDGTADHLSRGSLSAADGSSSGLVPDGLILDVLGYWDSPRGGRYPARWRLRVPERALDVEIVPVLADQEHDAYVRYWEGAVDVRGTHGGVPVTGHGYVELTGYAGPAARQLAR